MSTYIVDHPARLYGPCAQERGVSRCFLQLPEADRARKAILRRWDEWFLLDETKVNLLDSASPEMYNVTVEIVPFRDGKRGKATYPGKRWTTFPFERGDVLHMQDKQITVLSVDPPETAMWALIWRRINQLNSSAALVSRWSGEVPPNDAVVETWDYHYQLVEARPVPQDRNGFTYYEFLHALAQVEA